MLLLISCTVPLQPAVSDTEAPAAEESTTESATETTVDSAEVTTDTVAATDEGAADESAAAVSLVNEPEGEFKGIPVGFTAEGFPYRGSPDAPVVLYEYSDFQCPFCSRYFVQTEPAINESYVREGHLRVVFRDFPLAQLHPNAPAAHVAALCVADQGAVLYWEMHGSLFQTQAEWTQLSDAPAYFAELAQEVGVEMDAYQACVDSGQKEEAVALSVAEANALGFSGTPSFNFVREATNDAFTLVGAQPFDQFAAILDALIAGDTPQAAQPESGDSGDAGDGEIPFWATTEGLAPDPDRAGYTMAGDEYRGNPDASVVVVEFSDFQCPFCRKHVQETQPALDEQFVDTDQIFWVFKHFPLSIHPQAPAAGHAAECAGDQGQFWAMHELLFEETEAWSISDPTAIFVELAAELDLDADLFDACLNDASVAQRVEDDMSEGGAFVRGTPTFIVLYNGQGSIIPGALPLERFTEILQQVIDEAGS